MAAKTKSNANAKPKDRGEQKKKKARTSFSLRSVVGKILSHRVIKTLLKIVLILAVLPFMFILIYAIPGTKPASTLIMGRAAIGNPVVRNWVDIENVASVLPHSVIMSEDGRFCTHAGVDWRELNAVIEDALTGEKTRGASTLAMQTVKNLFLWPQRSFIRKIFEVPYALFADFIWSKRRMMEIYLNIVEWDEGVFGIEAASRHYFKKSASKLSRRQAALMTVSLPNPIARNPAKPSKSLLRLARVVEKRAKRSGAYIKCLRE